MTNKLAQVKTESKTYTRNLNRP